jgi:hypothetical protein
MTRVVVFDIVGHARRARSRLRCASAQSCVLALIVGGACSEQSEVAPPDVVERDSAGIHIVENARPAFGSGAGWTVSAEPIVEIGADLQGSDQTLFRVATALRLDNGGYVIASGSSPMLRWFDRRGKLVRGTGQAGSGPGEFAGEGGFIVALWRLKADSIATWDLLQRRLQVFDSAGRFTRSVTLRQNSTVASRAYPALVGRFDNGEILTSSTVSAQATAGAETLRDTSLYMRWSAVGLPLDTIARLPGLTTFAPTYWRSRIGARASGDGPPPPPPPLPPFAPRPVVWVSGDRFYYGSGDRYEIAVYDQTGALTTLIRAMQARTAVTRALIEAKGAELVARLPAGRFRDAYARLIAQSAHPDSTPPFDRILVDRTGALWVRDYLVPRVATVAWNVFEAGGRWLTRLELPTRLDIRDIGEDYVLALERDTLDVELIRVYSLARRGPAFTSLLSADPNMPEAAARR